MNKKGFTLIELLIVLVIIGILAGLVIEFSKSRNIIQAIDFAQECTTLVVQKFGVSTV